MTTVPLRLKPLPAAMPATALLLPGSSVAELLQLCARLGFDPLPAVYLVADGFLLKLPAPVRQVPVGVLGLRDLAEHLHLPAGAELVPAFLADEAQALTRSRGLVFLPGSRVLAYDPGRPVPLRDLVQFTNLSRPAWVPLPEAPALAERLFELHLEMPPPTFEEVLEQGQGDIASETPRPPDSGAHAKVVGNIQFGLGKGLAWLGKSLHLRGLTAAGAALIAGAMNLVPRLSEAVLGRQEAMLRELLRQFRDGKTEQALRRALPLGKDPARGSTAADDSNLPTHDTTYSLRNLFGDSGPARMWFGGSDEVYRQLGIEYRRLAEEATRTGDFRRAAFIYGKLLHDFRSAANALSRGGLHLDAAVLYLDRLGDTPAAAREYEAAGEFDRALQLYRQLGDHLGAAELLRRIGEDEQALAEFQQAARQLVERGRGHGEAGDLMLNKAGRPDLALSYFAEGWARRPSGSFLICAQRLLQMNAEEQKADALLTVLGEADQFFAPAGNDVAAAGFYNELARLSNQPALASCQAKLRDRALLGLAEKIRQQAAQGIPAVRVAANLLPGNGGWTPAQRSDAQFAVQSSKKSQQRPSSRREATSLRIPARAATVTAVCFAPASGHLFVGFAGGEVVRVHPLKMEVITITDEKKPILALATDPHAEDLVVLCQNGYQSMSLSHFCRAYGNRMVGSQVLDATDHVFLSPLLAGRLAETCGSHSALFWNGTELQFLVFPSLLPVRHWHHKELGAVPNAVLPIPVSDGNSDTAGVLVLEGRRILFYGSQAGLVSWQEMDFGWAPGGAKDNSLRHPHFSWLFKGAEGLELAGTGSDGTLEWSNLAFNEGRLVVAARRTEAALGPFLAAGIVRPGVVAAVSKTAVYWLQPAAGKFRVLDRAELAIPDAIACYPFSAGGMLIVLGSDGLVSLVPQRMS